MVVVSWVVVVISWVVELLYIMWIVVLVTGIKSVLPLKGRTET
jgi:hypothetical protein